MPKKKSGDFNQSNYINEYQKKMYRNFSFRINRNQSDVIEWLDSKKNKQGYIIDLIKADMEKEQR